MLPTPGFRKTAAFFFIAFFLFEHSARSLPPDVEHIQARAGFSEYHLKNGLTILLKEDKSFPVVGLLVHYRSGSRDEQDGQRGWLHLLEHMMFKNTSRYQEKDGKTVFLELQKTGARFNGGTWADGIQFTETFPAGELGTVLGIEAERMGRVVFTKENLEPEKKVVLSEFDQWENNPMNVLASKLWQTAFRRHPYHYAEIGERRDIQAAEPEALQSFYKSLIGPERAVIAAAGDFDTEDFLAKTAAAFGELPPARSPHVLYPEEPSLGGREAVVLRTDQAQNAVVILHRVPKAISHDSASLEVLARMLGDSSSGLSKSLVDTRIAASVSSESVRMHDPGIFDTHVTLNSGMPHDSAEKAVLAAYRAIAEGKFSDAALRRAQNGYLSSYYYEHDGYEGLLQDLSQGIAHGDWAFYLEFPRAIRSVTRADVQAAASRYLTPEAYAAGYLISNQPPDETTAEDRGEGEPDALSGKDEIPAPLIPLEAGRKDLKDTAIRKFDEPGMRILAKSLNVPGVFTVSGCFDWATDITASNRLMPSLVVEMLDKGTQTRTREEFAALAGNYGIQVFFAEKQGKVFFTVRALTVFMKETLELLADAMLHPVFPEEEWQKIKAQKRTDLSSAMTDPDRTADSALRRLIYRPSHPAWEPDFTAQRNLLEALTRDDLEKFYRANFLFRNLVVSAAGDFEPGEIRSAVLEAFREITSRSLAAGKSPLPAYRVFASPRRSVRIPVEGITKSDFYAGQALPLFSTDPDYFALMAANRILGGDFMSRLFLHVRAANGLAYQTYSTLGEITPRSQGRVLLTASLNPETLDTGRAAVLETYTSLAVSGVSPAELEAAKHNILGNFGMSLASTAEAAHQMLAFDSLGMGDTFPEAFPARIKALTVKEVDEAAVRYFHPGNLQEVVAEPAGGPKK